MADKVDHEKELQLGRAALTHKLIQPKHLIETLLFHSNTGRRKPLEKLFVERELLTPDQVRLLRADVDGRRTPAPPPTDPNAKGRLGKIVLKVLLDKIETEEPFITTYVGRLPRDPLPVALQLIDKATLRHGLWMDFLETVRGCKGLQSPNLVEVIDVDRTDDHFGIITRYQRGGMPLRELMRRIPRLKLSEALRVTREMAQGLEALHKQGVSHKDIKADNVLLGAKGEVQLRNPGVVFEPAGADAFASPRTVFGTMHSIPPECLKGELPGPASDVYSLGVLAYRLTTGVSPFEGETLGQLRDQHLNQPPIPPHSVMSALPEGISNLLVALLAKKPKDRPSASRVVGELKRLEGSIKRSGHTTKFQAFDAGGSSG